MSRILIDSNIFMYAAGSDHPYKRPSIALLEQVARGEFDAYIDAEVLQEILHRYRSIGRWSDGQSVYDMARRIVRNIVAIDAEMTDAAKALMNLHDELSARDALHAAVGQALGCDSVCSYDRDFDVLESPMRIEPQP